MDTPIVDQDTTQKYIGEHILVIPRAQARAFLNGARSPGIVVTDCGYFPRAERHVRARATPVDELIIIACVEGRGWCTTDDGTIPVEAGQILLVLPGRAHAYGAHDGDPWSVWWVHIAGASLDDFLGAHRVGTSVAERTPAAFFEIVSLLTRIVGVLERDITTAGLTVAAGVAWHALTMIVSDRSVARGMREVVQAAAAVIRDDLRAEVSAARFARGARVSTSHFSTQFRRQFGMSVKTYQLQVRMARARELFERGGVNVTEVAHAVGFGDPLYFSRRFAHMHDVAPSAYRAGDRGAAVIDRSEARRE